MNKHEKVIKSLLDSGVDIVSMICYVSEEFNPNGKPLTIEIDNILWTIDTVIVPVDFLPKDIDYIILESGTNYEQGLKKWIINMEVE